MTGNLGEALSIGLIRLNNLASLLLETNRPEEAEPLMRRALEIDEASLGAEHPDVAIALNNLAGLLQATNRLREAEQLMRRALAIDEASYGTEHPRVAIRLNNLTVLLVSTNRLAEAEPLLWKAIRILYRFEGRSGHRHPKYMSTRNNYASLLRAMGLPEAELTEKLAPFPA